MVRIISKSDPLKILLVEDSKGDRLLINHALNSVMEASYEVSESETLQEALKLLSDNQYDVALLDRTLPDVDGFDGMHNLQTMSPKLPIIFLTGCNEERFAFQAIEQGAQDYLFKDSFDGHQIKKSIQFAILRKQFEGIIITQANYDMLTGLANRMLFESRLEMAIAKMRRHQESSLSAMFIDLDDFKLINDEMGHQAGDKLLKLVGERLKQALRNYDTVARFGGDEFAILLESLPEESHGEVVARKIIKQFKEPFSIHGKDVIVGLSIGVSNSNSSDKSTSAQIIHQADLAMYKAKEIKESAYVLYDYTNDENNVDIAAKN